MCHIHTAAVNRAVIGVSIDIWVMKGAHNLRDGENGHLVEQKTLRKYTG